MIASIVVPVYNREKHIRGCIDSLLCQDFDDYEIIIVDDGSRDGTKEILDGYKDLRLRIIYNKISQGPSFCRNLASQQAFGQYIVFTDSDCIVDKKWLQKLISGFSTALIVIVGGTVEDPPARNYWEQVNQQGDFVGRSEGFVRKVIGCNMAVRKDFLITNVFDQRVYPSEDLDLCLRALRQKRKILYVPSAKVLHFRRDTFLSTMRQQFNYGFWNTYVNLKNNQIPFLSWGAWIFVFALICVGLGNFKIALGFIFIYLGMVFYIGIFQKGLQGKEFLMIYPGLLLGCLSNSLGSLRGFFASIGRRLHA